VAFLVAAAVGAPLRFLVERAVQSRTRSVLPWGTIVVNLTGCLALGAVTGLGLAHGLGATTRLVVGTGGLGAYTTFSTFSYETVRLVDEGATDEALRNVALSLVGGFLAAAAGVAVTLAW
jgi:CrcB protein